MDVLGWRAHGLWVLALLMIVLQSRALAGGGPETTLLVVNDGSPASLQVANSYIRLRDIPDHHVLWLKDVPTGDTIDVDDLRKRVLGPIRAHLKAFALEDEIDLIAYSAGFPYAVDFRKDEQANGLEADRLRGEGGSLTGMTFFARKVAAGQVDYLVPQANHFARRPLGAPIQVLGSRAGRSRSEAVASVPDLRMEPARGFRSRYLWGRGPGPIGMAETDHYRLAVMLGYTALRGNSVPEIERYLARAAASDGTRPAGTVYLMANRDIRSRVRQHLFESTVSALRARGLRAEVLSSGRGGQNGREPRGRKDVIGLVAGTKTFDWASSKSVLLPGAIAESFTSYGGHFGHFPQTKLSEFLRHGAAGSSGAVREPYALVAKFPLPQMHVHYADGVSLAEAFYLSVLSPYQLLVVGDPLARPFAWFAQVSLPGWNAAEAVRGELRLRPELRPAPERPIERLELWVDGLLMTSGPPGDALLLDTRGLADGEHDLRVVAVEAGAIETRSYVKTPLRVDNRGRVVAVASSASVVPWGRTLELAGDAAGARRVRVQHLGRVLADVPVREGRWRAAVATDRIGLGEVALTVVAEWADGSRARSAPVALEVALPRLIAPVADPSPVAVGAEADEAPGPLEVVAEHVGEAPVRSRIEGLWKRLPRELRASRASRLVVTGAFETRAEGLYEMDVEVQGEVSLQVAGSQVAPVYAAPGAAGTRFALPLAAGWHRFELAVSNPRSHAVRASLSGPEVAFVLADERVRAR